MECTLAVHDATGQAAAFNLRLGTASYQPYTHSLPYPPPRSPTRCLELTVLFRTPLTSNMTLTSASLLPSHSCKAKPCNKRLDN